MHPRKAVRGQTNKLTDLPNIGKAMAADLNLLGIHRPADLSGQNPYAMYEQLCVITGVRHDPCVLDVFLSITDFMNGGQPQPWWHYTSERKKAMQSLQG